MTTPLTAVSSGVQAPAGVAAVRPVSAATGDASQSAANASPASSPPDASTALAAAVRAAAATQGGLAGLLADLRALLGAEDLPADVRAAAELVLAAQLSTDPPPSADDLRQAVAQSGLFLESQLAAVGAPTPGDMKAALLNLGQALQPWSAAMAQTAARAVPPALPYPGGPMQGQLAQASTLPPNATMAMAAARVSRETDGALSRQVLMQAASSSRSAEGARGAHWLFELPLATPGGASVAQFEIDRDGSRDRDEEDGPTWRANFSLNLTGVGPVHARVALRGGKVRVALWAEDGATLAELEAHREDLAEALREEGLSPQLVLFPGAPEAKPPGAGRFMDRAV